MRRVPSLWTGVLLLGALGFALAIAAAGRFGDVGWRSAAFAAAFLFPLYAVGVFARVKRPDLPISRLLVAAASLAPLAGGVDAFLVGLSEEPDPPSWLWALAFLALVAAGAALGAVGTLFALFPDGRAHRRYERVVVGIVWTLVALVPPLMLASDPALTAGEDESAVSNPVAVSSLEGLSSALDPLLAAPLLLGAALLAFRFRRAPAEQRNQIKWLLPVPLAGVVVLSFSVLVDVHELAAAAIEYTLLALLPTSIAVAIFRHRLLDIDFLLRRSLVYGALWLLIGATYVGVAASLGIAAGERLPVAVAVLLAVAATLVFQPARRRLDRLVDRWLFGERLTGHELLARFGETLEETVNPDELLGRLEETVRRGLGVAWVRARVDPYDGNGRVAAPDAELAVPIAHAGETIGAIECGPKTAGSFTVEDRELLENLGRQAALAVRNARLAVELAGRLSEIRQQTDELRASRARLVHAQDAERRRIERNIHDGVQQNLVAVIAKLRLARNQLARGSDRAADTLAELQAEAGTVLQDLRELAQGIHPSLLTDRGLVAAIEGRALGLPIEVRIDAAPGVRGSRYDDEIEGAAYFVVSEALANVLKHARARRAHVRVHDTDDRLLVEVRDDGAGFEPEGMDRRGLADLSDRLAALGGRLTVTSRRGGGTIVRAWLPARERARA